MNIFQNQNLADIKVELDLSNYAAKADIKMKQLLLHQILLKRLIRLI